MKGIDFKAVIIEASAGTGKTSRITREFTGVLDRKEPAAGMRKILAVTFSEKAAIEMKMRILEKIYAEIYPALSEEKKVEAENAMLRLRISTIHSFCRLILRRFAFYAGMDPFFTVIDERQSDLLYYRAFGSFLNSRSSAEILQILKYFKLPTLKELLFAVRKCHPYATVGTPEGGFSERISVLSHRIAGIHSQMKRDLSMIDFNDLEILTYRLLEEYPDSLTILEDFDEKNNYIFVDEFQDTNILQWRIIYKLIEEWLSGYGAKAEKGESYGIFLVGDKKQSIYKFRGAEGKVFDDAKHFLRDYYLEEQLLRNYRSAREIIKFVNNVFEDTHPWTEQMLSPGLEREMPFRIEIKLTDGKDNPDAKNEEYEWVLSKIFELIERKEPVWDKKREEFRPIDFRDMAILMRKRVGKSFLLLEKRLKESGVPFVILGGIGFYREPEIIFLLSLVLALADPTDDISLWNLRNSVYGITAEKIYRWRKLLSGEELTMVVEHILKELAFWVELSTQQKANTEKFLMLLQDWEGLPLYGISKNLRTMSRSYDEPKADIFSEHQNAVRVLTVHNAKGLEFPAVFLLNVEDGKVMLKDTILYRKAPETGPPYTFVLKSEAEEGYTETFRGLLEEEEERVLYVALTRVCQYLFISGTRGQRGAEKGLWMNRLSGFESAFPATPVYVRTVMPREEKREEKAVFEETVQHAAGLTSYTQEKEQDYYHYERTVAGEIAHKILRDISEGRIKIDKQAYGKRTKFYLGKTGLHETAEAEKILMSIYQKIEKNKEIKNVVKKEKSGRTFSELPFIVEMEKGRVYTGFIDRVVLSPDNRCSIYDYKLEGVNVEPYRRQMDIYEKAVRNILPDSPVIKRFIIFLLNGTIEKI